MQDLRLQLREGAQVLFTDSHREVVRVLVLLEDHLLLAVQVIHQAQVLLAQDQALHHLDHQAVAEVLEVVQDHQVVAQALQVVAEDVNLNLLKRK